MAITTLAQVRSGLQPIQPFVKQSPNYGNAAPDLRSTTWYVPALPVAGAADTNLNGDALSFPVTGAIQFNNPPSGNCYLARLQASAAAGNGSYAGQTELTLCDRLWHSGGLDITGASSPQSITSPTWPARDINGATAGDGVFLACELSAAVTSGPAPTISIGYTNSGGTSGLTSNNIRALMAGGAGAYSGLFIPMGLTSGDTGVQSVQSFSISASSWVGGTIQLVAYRPIARVSLIASGKTSAIDAITAGLPQLYNNSVLFFVTRYQASTGASTLVSGNIQYTFG